MISDDEIHLEIESSILKLDDEKNISKTHFICLVIWSILGSGFVLYLLISII